MGQNVTALMYGVLLKDNTRKLFWNNEATGLLDAGEPEGVGRLDSDENSTVIGIALGVSAGGEDGERLLPEAFRMSDASKLFRSELKEAKQKWKALLKALKEKTKGKAKLPEPDFFLVQVERA